VKFETQPQIALSQIEAELKAGVARGVVLADAGYGVDGAFRARRGTVRKFVCELGG
jgi:SRSO17 transposase